MLLPNAKLTLITPPTIEPLDLASAKNYLRVEISDDDALIEDMISAARLECEHRTGRSFLNQTWRITLDYLPFTLGASPLGFALGAINPFNRCDGSIQLPRPPLISVDSISFVDSGGVPASFDLDQLIVSPGTPGRIAPAFGRLFPFSLPQIASVSIDYVAGYGSDPASVPRNIIQAIRLLTAHYYEHRSDDAPIPAAVDALLAPSWWPSYA